MAGKVFTGSTSGVLFQDRRQFYIKPQQVAELWPSVAPFTTMLINAGVRYNPQDPMYKLFQHKSAFVHQYMQDNDAAGVTGMTKSTTKTLNIDGITNLASSADSSYIGLELEVWDSTKTTKRGVMVVTAVPSSSSITCKALHIASGSTLDISDNDYFVVVGNVRGEGTTAPEAWSDELETVWNQTQYFSVPVEVKGKLLKAALRGYSDELARLRMEKAKEFKMQKEHAFLKGGSPLGTNMDSSGTFSDGQVTDADGNILRTTMGIIPMIEKYGASSGDTQNKFSIDSSTYTYSDFVDDMEKVFQYDDGSGNKFAFVGPGALSYWSKLDGTSFFAGKSGWSVNITDMKTNKLGFNVRILETPHGLLHLVPTKALKYEYNKTMVAVDQSNLYYMVYEEDQFKNDIKKEDDYNGVKDVYTGDAGLGATLIESHNLFTIS